MVTFEEFRAVLNQSVGDLIRHHLRIGFIRTFVRSTIGDEVMVFQIEAVKRHCKGYPVAPKSVSLRPIK